MRLGMTGFGVSCSGCRVDIYWDSAEISGDVKGICRDFSGYFRFRV